MGTGPSMLRGTKRRIERGPTQHTPSDSRWAERTAAARASHREELAGRKKSRGHASGSTVMVATTALPEWISTPS